MKSLLSACLERVRSCGDDGDPVLICVGVDKRVFVVKISTR